MHVRDVRLNNRTDSVLSYECGKYAASYRSGAGDAICCCHDMVRHRRERREERRKRRGERGRGRGDRIGLDWIRLDWIRLDWIGLDWIG